MHRRGRGRAHLERALQLRRLQAAHGIRVQLVGLLSQRRHRQDRGPFGDARGRTRPIPRPAGAFAPSAGRRCSGRRKTARRRASRPAASTIRPWRLPASSCAIPNGCPGRSSPRGAKSSTSNVSSRPGPVGRLRAVSVEADLRSSRAGVGLEVFYRKGRQVRQERRFSWPPLRACRFILAARPNPATSTKGRGRACAGMSGISPRPVPEDRAGRPTTSRPNAGAWRRLRGARR